MLAAAHSLDTQGDMDREEGGEITNYVDIWQINNVQWNSETQSDRTLLGIELEIVLEIESWGFQ